MDGRTVEEIGLGLGFGRWRWFRRWVARGTGMAWACYEYRVAGFRRVVWLPAQEPAALRSRTLSPWLHRAAKVVAVEFWRGPDERYVCLREGALGDREVLVDGRWMAAAPWLLVWDREREQRRKEAA